MELAESNKDGRWRRWVAAGMGILLLLAAGGYLVHSLKIGKGGGQKKPPKISLLPDKPPPPPPKEEKKPEPPKQDQKEIKAEPPKEPQPQAQNEPLKMEGAAGDGPSAFAAGTVNKEYIGGAVGIGGGGMQYAFYTNLLQRHLQDELNRNRKLRESDYRVTVRIWLGKDGVMRRAELAQSTGNDTLDDLLRQVLTQVSAMREAPPENMPQPVRIRITARGTS
jgi:protein TonB